MSEFALQLHGCAKVYGSTVALRAVTLELRPGEILAVLGANGSGKTTLLKLVAGALTPTRGSGQAFGFDLFEQREELRLLIGLLAGDSYLYDDLTALENLHFTVTMAGLRPRDELLRECLDRVGLARQAGERVRGFSSGMRRRLSLARVLALPPRLLLLDEPYNSLDAAGMRLVDELIQTTVQRQGAVMLATHDAERALALADGVLALDRGRVAYTGAPAGYGERRDQYVG